MLPGTYPVWGSLARDYLAIMVTLVSSEQAFSSSAITISKRRNQLSSDIIEALDPLVLSELGKEDTIEVGSDDAVVSEENGGLEVDLVDSDSDIIVSGFE